MRGKNPRYFRYFFILVALAVMLSCSLPFGGESTKATETVAPTNTTQPTEPPPTEAPPPPKVTA